MLILHFLSEQSTSPYVTGGKENILVTQKKYYLLVIRSIKTNTILKALIKFFTLFGLPKSIQSDQGTNFMAHAFQQVMNQLGIKQYKSSAYHPESQGALERFHQTLKTMIRMYSIENS